MCVVKVFQRICLGGAKCMQREWHPQLIHVRGKVFQRICLGGAKCMQKEWHPQFYSFMNKILALLNILTLATLPKPAMSFLGENS